MMCVYRIMEGGVNSGFVRVADKAEYIPRLTLVSRDKNKKVVLKEVSHQNILALISHSFIASLEPIHII